MASQPPPPPPPNPTPRSTSASHPQSDPHAKLLPSTTPNQSAAAALQALTPSAKALLNGFTNLITTSPSRSPHILGRGLHHLPSSTTASYDYPKCQDVPLSTTTDSLVHAAIESRLPITSMSATELKSFGKAFTGTPQLLDTYLSVRNSILRQFFVRPNKALSLNEAVAACAGFRLDLVASVYVFLVRYSHINFGLVRPPDPGTLIDPSVAHPAHPAPRARRVIIIGAGAAGLACARQLRHIADHQSSRAVLDHLKKHALVTRIEPPMDIILLEARNRVGGRVYTHPLYTKARTSTSPYASTFTTGVDLGAKVVTGWDGGNPVKTIVRGQLLLPTVDLHLPTKLYHANGAPVRDNVDREMEDIFNEVLDHSSQLRESLLNSAVTPPPPPTDLNSDDDYQPSPIIVHKSRKRRAHPTHSSPSLDSSIPEHSTTELKSPTSSFANDSSKSRISLGDALHRSMNLHPRVCNLSEPELQVLHWHLANLEFANAATLDSVSLHHWDQDDENEFLGPHGMIVGGYGQVIHAFAYGCRTMAMQTGADADGIATDALDIRLNSAVTNIQWSKSLKSHLRDTKNLGPEPTNVRVTLSDGSQLTADAVVVTVPLGVLKAKSIQFTPDLPRCKVRSIDQLGFGTLNKIVLVFHQPFWDVNVESFGYTNPADPETGQYEPTRGKSYLFWNMMHVVKLPVLVAMNAGMAAFRSEATPDNLLVQEVLDILRKIHPTSAVPSPLETVVTRWSYDEYTRGCYSYVALGSSGDDYSQLAAPLGHTLYFAGEHTCREYPATVHGALLSGMRAASEIGNAFYGNVKYVENPHLIQVVEPSPADAHAQECSSSVALTFSTLTNGMRAGSAAAALAKANDWTSNSQDSSMVDSGSQPRKREAVVVDDPVTPVAPAARSIQQQTLPGSVIGSPTPSMVEASFSGFSTPDIDSTYDGYGEDEPLSAPSTPSIQANTTASRRQRKRRRTKADERALETKVWHLCPGRVASSHIAAGSEIACTLPSCTLSFTDPVAYHRHLVMHVPEPDRALYSDPDANGEYRGLPNHIMPTPAKAPLKNAFLLFMKTMWSKARQEVEGDHHFIRQYLADQWRVTGPAVKQMYNNEVERLKLEYANQMIRFNVQCAALGLQDYQTARERSVPLDLVSLGVLSPAPDQASASVDMSPSVARSQRTLSPSRQTPGPSEPPHPTTVGRAGPPDPPAVVSIVETVACSTSNVSPQTPPNHRHAARSTPLFSPTTPLTSGSATSPSRVMISKGMPTSYELYKKATQLNRFEPAGTSPSPVSLSPIPTQPKGISTPGSVSSSNEGIKSYLNVVNDRQYQEYLTSMHHHGSSLGVASSPGPGPSSISTAVAGPALQPTPLPDPELVPDAGGSANEDVLK